VTDALTVNPARLTPLDFDSEADPQWAAGQLGVGPVLAVQQLPKLAAENTPKQLP